MANDIPISSATRKQLIKFGINHLGWNEPDQSVATEALRARVKKAHRYDTISVEDADMEAEPETVNSPAVRAMFTKESEVAAPPKTVKVIVQNPNTEDPDQRIFVGVNGRNMLIEPNIVSEIPWAYYLALQNSVRYTYPNASDDGLGEPKPVFMYPFQRVE